MTTASIPVRLNRVATVEVSVSWATRDGTGQAGTDYTPASGTLTFAPGETVKNIAVEVAEIEQTAAFFIDLSEPMGAQLGRGSATITIAKSLVPEVTSMLAAQFAYIQRATGAAAEEAGMPSLVTAEGLVKNNQHTETLLGGYFPNGVSTSEGMSLLMRGAARAFAATGEAAYRTYFDFLFDCCCDILHFGDRPPANPATPWPHTWIINGGDEFAVRGPIPANGALDQTGYVGIPVTFTAGVGQLSGTPPDVIYQVATQGAEFIWPNVFAEIIEGTGSRVDVDYYINAQSQKVYGVQKGGSFGQPIEPDSEEAQGKIVLKGAFANYTGTLVVNYCVLVPEVTIAHAEPLEGWPMWRKLMPGEASMAGDAFHWFADAYRIMAEEVPGNAEYSRAHAAMLATWQTACNMDSAGTLMFKAGATGKYNDYPLTYAYAYGRENVDDPGTTWDAVPPTGRFSVERSSDGMVTFAAPAMNAAQGSGGLVRFGLAFENEPLYLGIEANTTISAQLRSDRQLIAAIELTKGDGSTFASVVSVDTSTTPKNIALSTVLAFQTNSADSDGVASGTWPDDPSNWTPPVYNAVPFPGRRVALVGDSITWMNTFWNPPIGTPGPWPDTPGGSDTPGGGWGSGGGAGTGAIGYYEYFGHGMCGYFTYANQMIGQRLVLEPHMQDRQAAEASEGQPVGRYKNGNNFAIAGSRTINWELGQDNTLGDGVMEVGPMFNARRNMHKLDVVAMLGGTNDLAGAQVTAQTVFHNLRRFAYEFAAAGKWVFIQTIMPRTREWLGGWYSPAGGGWTGPGADPSAAYTIAKQDIVRQRILQVNQMLREEFGPGAQKYNIWLVDSYYDLTGPNGLDPFGHQSNDLDPLAKATHGNYRSDMPGIVGMYDGLHPGPGAAFVAGRKLADMFGAAGVPDIGNAPSSPLSHGPNLIANPNWNFTTARPTEQRGKSNWMGRARGLGRARADSSHPYFVGGAIPSDYDYLSNLGIGYEHGNVPDHWFFYRSRNNFPGADPLDPPEGFSNFNEYTWSALANAFPELNAYMGDSTWPDGAVKTSVVTINGNRALKIDVNIPQTGNKNESFILRTMVPHGQHGPWDNYGYAVFDYAAWFSNPANNGIPPTQDDVNTIVNNLYAPGDKLYGEAWMRHENMVGLYTWRMALNFLAVDSSAVSAGDTDTTGARMSTFANSQNFWPPSLLDEVRLPPNFDFALHRTPVVTASEKRFLENQYYLQFNLEFAFDASAGPASGTIYIVSPAVFKVTGGSLL